MSAGPASRAAARQAILAAPGDPDACAGWIRGLASAPDVFRWFLRLAILSGGGIDGDVLRRAIVATAAIEVEVLVRTADAAVVRKDRLIPSFVAASLLVNRRVDAAAVAAMPIRIGSATRGLRRILAILSDKPVPVSVEVAFDVMIAKQRLAAVLQSAGYFDTEAAIDRGASVFVRRIRRNLHGEEFRGFTEHWTFAIGHLVLLAFLLKGMDAGLLDFSGAKVWTGHAANPFLMREVLALSSKVEVVRPWSTFADNHSSGLLEWIDGRYVDCLEACGIVADRAGDDAGAILPRPSAEHPALAGFRAAAGIAPDDRIVTLHCREAGYRQDGRHDLRNVDIAGYVPALRALVDRGYRVVRLGDRTMTPLPPIDGVIDYATSRLKTPELDVLLPGSARFHVGSSSGLSLVPLLYGTPCLFLNWNPIAMLPWGRGNWTVLKPLVARADGRRVVDPQRIASLGQIREAPLLDALGHAAVDLAPSEVERTALAFAAATETGGAPPRIGRNIGRLLVADDDGELRDLPVGATGSPS